VNAKRGGNNVNLELVTEIAALYYVEGLKQEEISAQLNLSRAKVGRLLKRAHDEGIVEVRVRHHPAVSAPLEHELLQRFALDRALIAIDHKDIDRQRAAAADLVAKHLDRSLADGSIAAIAMGRNVSAIAANAFAPAQRECLFVAGIGGSQRAGEEMNPDHIARRLAACFGGESETLYAPALVADPSLREAVLNNHTVKQTLDRARRADMAVIGVGDISEDSNMVRMGWFSPQEIAQARLSGTIGDMMGYDFIDIHGQPAAVPMQGRVVGLTISELKRIPDVVAIASEKTKAAAILGALRTGVINTLATSATNAHSVIKLDDATRNSQAQIRDQAE